MTSISLALWSKKVQERAPRDRAQVWLCLRQQSMKSNRGSCIACATKPPATPSLQHHVMFSHQQPLLIMSVLWLGKIMNMLVGRISWSPTRTGMRCDLRVPTRAVFPGRLLCSIARSMYLSSCRFALCLLWVVSALHNKICRELWSSSRVLHDGFGARCSSNSSHSLTPTGPGPNGREPPPLRISLRNFACSTAE